MIPKFELLSYRNLSDGLGWHGLAPFEPHGEVVARAQSKSRLWDNFLIDGIKAQSVLLGNGRQEQHRFHLGKTVPDAHARPGAKGQISKLRYLLLIFLRKPLWIEYFRLAPPAPIIVQHVRADENDRFGWQRVAAQFNRDNRLPSNGRDRRAGAPPALLLTHPLFTISPAS